MDNSNVSAKAIPPWSIARAAGYSMLVIIAFFAVQIVVVFIILVVQVLSDPELNIEQWANRVESNGLVLSFATVATALLCVPFVTFLSGRRERDRWAFLYLRPTSVRPILIWILALVAFVAVSDSLTIAIGRPVVPEFMVGAYSSVHPVFLFAALVLAAPAFEEIFFRGFILSALESSGVSAVSAAVVSSLAWSAIHLQYGLYEIGTIFLLGLMLAAARAKTGSLIPCLAMHAFANLIAFTQAALASRPAVV